MVKLTTFGDKRICNRCHELKNLDEFTSDKHKYLGKAHRCRICDAKRSREFPKKKNITYYEQMTKYYDKTMARRQVILAIKRGEITRGICEVCGVSDVQGHHEDYSKPLEVRWLCRKHHMELHRKPVQALTKE